MSKQQQEHNEITDPVAQAHVYENGIFNLVVTLAREKANVMPRQKAYDEVARYLYQIADSLMDMEQPKQKDG